MALCVAIFLSFLFEKFNEANSTYKMRTIGGATITTGHPIIT